MNRGYTVEEAARVLGIPTERVWDLVARGVFSGARGEDGTWRVHLGGSTAEGAESPPPGPDGSRPMTDGPPAGAGGELSPFRELLTEFRHLTERYGQALLALGEARGEVASLNARVDALETRVDLRLPFSGPAPGAQTVNVPPIEVPHGDEPSAVVATPLPVELDVTDADRLAPVAETQASVLAREEAPVAPLPAGDAAAASGVASLTQDGAEVAAETGESDEAAGDESADEAPAPGADVEAPEQVDESAPMPRADEEPQLDAAEAEESSTGEPGAGPDESAAVAGVAETTEDVAEDVADSDEAEASGEADHAPLDGEPALPDADLPQGDLPSRDEEFETIDDLLVLAEGDAAQGDAAVSDEASEPEEGEEGEAAAQGEAAEEAPEEAAPPDEGPAPDESGATVEAASDDAASEPAPSEEPEPAAEPAEPTDDAEHAQHDGVEAAAIGVAPGAEGEPAQVVEPTADAGLPDDGAFAIEEEPTQRRRTNRLGEEIAAALARADDPSPPELPNGTDQGQHDQATQPAEPAQPAAEETVTAPIEPSRQWPPFARRTEAGEEALLWIGRQPEDEADYAAEMEVGSAGWQTDASSAPAPHRVAAAIATDDLGADPYPDQAELIDALGWEQDEVEAIRSLLSGGTPPAREAWPAADPDVRQPSVDHATTASGAVEEVGARDEPAAAQEEPPAARDEPLAAPEAPTVAHDEPALAQEEPPAAPEAPAVADEEPAVAQEEPPAASAWPAADRAPDADATPSATPEVRRFELPGAADLDAALAALRRRSFEEAAAEERDASGAADVGRVESTAAGEVSTEVSPDDAAGGSERPAEEPADAAERPPTRPGSGLEDPAWSRRSPAANAYRRLRRFLGG